MRSLRTLLVAVPSVALGALLAATLTTTARAQEALKGSESVKPKKGALPTYRIANTEAELNALANTGYEVRFVTSTSSNPVFVMEQK